jgi:hypothetical protein
MNCRVPDADRPHLGIGMAGQQTLGRCQGIFRYLEGSGVEVEGHDLAVIAVLSGASRTTASRGLFLGSHRPSDPPSPLAEFVIL